MKITKLLILIIFPLWGLGGFAQEELSKEEKERRERNIQAANPFAKFGYKAKVATLSKGKYLEVHDLDSIVTIGTTRWHVDKNKIVGDIVIDSLNPDARPIGDVAGRWISPDPLSEEFPSWSPYNMSFNNPIKFVDPDGRAPIDPNEYDFDITTGKTTLVSNKGGNTTDYVNYTRGEGENKHTIWSETIPVENTITNIQTNGEMNFGPFFDRSPGKSTAIFHNGRSGALSDPSADIFMSWAGGKIAGQLIGAAWKGISGLFATESTVAVNGVTAEGAVWVQKTFSGTFSAEGTFAGQTVEGVAGALRSGTLSAADVSINLVVRNGQTYILNTRSSAALMQAGIPRSAWNVVNQTGVSSFESMLTNQLGRNGLINGVNTIRQSGTQINFTH